MTPSVAVELDAGYSAGTAVLTVVPLATAWAWRQTRNARTVDRLEPVARSSRFDRRRLPIALVTAVLVVLAGVAVAQSIQRDWDSVYGCPSLPENERIREWWTAHGGQAQQGCPTRLSGTTRSGEPYAELAQGTILTFIPRGEFLLPSDMFFVWQSRWEELGDPIDIAHEDGFAYYANFQFGHISRTPGGQPRAVIGSRYRHATYAGGPCSDHDRPCLASARREGTTIRIAWHWRTADAFNVNWRLERGNVDFQDVEVAGYDYVIRDVYPFESYIVRLQACNKRFLQISICTPAKEYLVP